ncbi:MAG: calcium/sodium antiporter, partial [cyanobacterium endosymbiont of Rhopalodia yunnanensis]
IAITISCLPIFLTGNVIDRWEGLLFVSYYIAYTTYLILRSTEHNSLQIFSNIMLLVVIPLTVLTLTIATVNSLWKQR